MWENDLCVTEYTLINARFTAFLTKYYLFLIYLLLGSFRCLHKIWCTLDCSDMWTKIDLKAIHTVAKTQ